MGRSNRKMPGQAGQKDLWTETPPPPPPRASHEPEALRAGTASHPCLCPLLSQCFNKCSVADSKKLLGHRDICAYGSKSGKTCLEDGPKGKRSRHSKRQNRVSLLCRSSELLYILAPPAMKERTILFVLPSNCPLPASPFSPFNTEVDLCVPS